MLDMLDIVHAILEHNSNDIDQNVVYSPETDTPIELIYVRDAGNFLPAYQNQNKKGQNMVDYLNKE